MLASIYDALNQNTRATGNWGKKGPPEIPAFPRPKSKSKPKPAADEAPKTGLVKRLYNQFTRR